MKKVYRKEIEKIVEKYNKYRSPEARAEILKVENNKIKIKFSGIFCRTCGINDWIEDFVYLAKDFGMSIKVENVEEPKNYVENFRIATFRIEKS